MFPTGLLVTLAVGYAAAILFFFARELRTGTRSFCFLSTSAVVLSSALVLDVDRVFVRYLAALILLIFLLHMWDLHLDPYRSTRLSLGAYMVFLADYAWSVARVADDYGINLTLRQRARDAVNSVAGLCLVSALAVGLFKVNWAAYPFLVEHAVKSTCLAAWTIWAFHANTALWRLAGAPAARFTTRNVLWSYSPAESWRRWNRPMHRWLLENVYQPAGGRRNPHLATLAVFAVSGVLHEYLWDVSLRRVTGYTVAFFLLHGAATVLTRRFKPSGRLVVPAVILTFAFNTCSTVLLFIPINGRMPFYTNEVPKWLYLW
jgi:hypothetical protein